MDSWLEENDMEIHSTNNEGKSVVAETFIRTLRQKKKQKKNTWLKYKKPPDIFIN